MDDTEALPIMTQKQKDQILEIDSELFGPYALKEYTLEKILNDETWLDIIYVEPETHQVGAYAFGQLRQGKVRNGIYLTNVKLARLVVRKDIRGRGFGSTIHQAMVATPGYRYSTWVPEEWTDSQLWLSKRGWKATKVHEMPEPKNGPMDVSYKFILEVPEVCAEKDA